jgi:hypothetical protein
LALGMIIMITAPPNAVTRLRCLFADYSTARARLSALGGARINTHAKSAIHPKNQMASTATSTTLPLLLSNPAPLLLHPSLTKEANNRNKRRRASPSHHRFTRRVSKAQARRARQLKQEEATPLMMVRLRLPSSGAVGPLHAVVAEDDDDYHYATAPVPYDVGLILADRPSSPKADLLDDLLDDALLDALLRDVWETDAHQEEEAAAEP